MQSARIADGGGGKTVAERDKLDEKRFGANWATTAWSPYLELNAEHPRELLE